MSSSERESTDLTICALCHATFAEPRSLPCVHTFCLKCLERQANVNDITPHVTCPICAKQFRLPATGVAGLPANNFVEKLIKLNRLMSPKSRQSPCEVCSGNDASGTKLAVTAVSFCINCAENMCESCATLHQRMKQSRAHTVVSLGTPVSAQDIAGCSTSKCDQHPDEPIKMFCNDCEQCICFMCYAEHHTGHRCHDMHKVADKFRSDIEEIISNATNILSEEHVDKEELEKRRMSFVSQIQQQEASIHQTVAKLRNLVESHSAELLEKLNDIKRSGLRNYEQTKQEMEHCWTVTDGFRRYAKEIHMKGSVDDVVQSAKLLQQRVDELQLIHSAHHEHQFTFQTTGFIPTNVQQLLTSSVVSNIVGNIASNAQRSCSAGVLETKDHNFKTHGNYANSSSLSRMLPSTKHSCTHQISAKGSLVIRDCSVDGKCVTIENTAATAQLLGGWTVRRVVDGDEVCVYSLLKELNINGRAKLRLWSKGSKPTGVSAVDIETNLWSWGVGNNIITQLINAEGQECATHYQKLVLA